MIAYKYDTAGAYMGTVTLYESPREPGVYPMIPNTTLLEPSSPDDCFIDGVWVAQTIERTSSDAAGEKIDEINSGFAASVSGQIEVKGMTFDHGLTSVLKIFLAIEKSSKAGEQTRKLYESDETPHELPLESALEIAVAIGNDYDSKDASMRAYKKQVTDIVSGEMEDGAKVAAIDALVISYE